MVSTRGGARTGTDEIAPADEIPLRKKPVRKAAAKPRAKPTAKPTITKAATAKTTTNAKPASEKRTTRSKKTASELEQETVDDEVDELDQEEHAEEIKVARKVTSVARKVTSRPKKTEEPEKVAPAPKARDTSKTTAIATSRTAKRRLVDDDAPALPPPTKSAATRATRATASKSKAPPLSPKKITQVAKAPGRSTRNAKAPASKPAKSTAAAKPATRRRNVSDENADISNARSADGNDEHSKEEVATSSTAHSKPLVSRSKVTEDETPMSSRPTTPAGSPPANLDDEKGDEGTDLGMESESESEAEDDQEISADELFGPKTPMKRVSPREQSRFISAQRSPQRGDASMATPARRFAVLGTQRGTPQTQKPYCKPTVPSSELRPMTVARARDRAMVFPKLQPLSALAAPNVDMDLQKEGSEVEHNGLEKSSEETEVAEEDFLDQPNSVAEEREESSGILHSKVASDPDDETTDGPEDITINFGDDTLVFGKQLAESRQEPIIHFSMEDVRPTMSATTLVNGFEGKTLLNTEAYDANETIMEDEEMEDVSDGRGDVSGCSEDSVIITRETAIHDESMLDDCALDDSLEAFQLSARTPRPETIVWGNLRDDVTIPFNFNGDVSPCRALPQAEATELLSINNAEAAGTPTESKGVPATTHTHGTSADRTTSGTVRQSFDATVNLSEFIDASFLAERQQNTPTPITPAVDRQLNKTVDHNCEEHVALPMPNFEFPSTPSHEPFPMLPDVPDRNALQDTPHYALPTIATRRKSLPSIVYRTPVRDGARPQTAVGASMPRVLHPFADKMAARDGSMNTAATPDRRLSTMAGDRSASRNRTPFTGMPRAGTSRLSSPRADGRTTPSKTYAEGFAVSSSLARSEATLTIRQSPSKTPRTSGSTSKRQTPTERFPGLPSRETYEELAGSPAVHTPGSSAAFMTPVSAAAPAERFPGLPPAQNYEELAAAVVKDSTKAAADKTTTPQREVQERYPGLPHRRTYEEHARTAMPPSRFRTPAAQAAKRPATTRKPSSLRKIALKAAGSHTPVQTPLKAASITPGQVPCTPHPSAPLKGVNAYVEVFLSDGSCATTTYISVLQALGAKTTKTLNTDRVTHVVYKEGSPTTLQRLRHHNRQVEEGVGSMIHCVNGRWVNDCKEFGKHVDELNEAYIVELDDFHAAKRRRKSMEPMSLINIGGNVVRDRKSSSSLGRSAMLKLISSPAETGASTPPMEGTPANKENNGDDSFTGIESPETPAYLAAPESLVQQTAPANRIRKLDLQAGEVKNRRLTFWDGGA